MFWYVSISIKLSLNACLCVRVCAQVCPRDPHPEGQQRKRRGSTFCAISMKRNSTNTQLFPPRLLADKAARIENQTFYTAQSTHTATTLPHNLRLKTENKVQVLTHPMSVHRERSRPSTRGRFSEHTSAGSPCPGATHLSEPSLNLNRMLSAGQLAAHSF